MQIAWTFFFEKTAITQMVKTAWNHHNFSVFIC